MRQEMSRERRYRYRRLQVRVKEKPNPLGWRAAVLLGLLLGAGITYVALISTTDRLQRSHRKLLKAYDEGNKALENSRLELETFSSPEYIERQVKAMNLGLHKPYTGQVRRMSLKGDRDRAEFSEEGLLPEPPEAVARLDAGRPAADTLP